MEFSRQEHWIGLLCPPHRVSSWTSMGVACVGLIFLVWRLFSVWMPPAFFLGVCWPCYPCCRCADVVAGCPLPEFSVVAAACVHPWSPQWQWLAPDTKVTAGGVLLPRSQLREKGCSGGACPSPLMHPPNNGTWPLKSTRLPLLTHLVVVTPDFNPFSVSCWQPQSSPWVWATKPETLHWDPSCTSEHVSQVRECRAEAITILCRFLSILDATNWWLSSLLWLQSCPSVEADLPSGKETSQSERIFPLS